MHDDTDLLRKEILRLQAVLDHHGIDYEPEEFGPPTLLEYHTGVEINRMASRFARVSIMADAQLVQERNLEVQERNFASGTQWTASLLVRLPVDYD